MGRCNGGGGARHGGGGFQDGQSKGTKSGKAGHGRSGAHDSSQTQRETQKRDKFGKPINYGPYVNGYHVGGAKQAAQGLGIHADNAAVQELGALVERLEDSRSKAGGGPSGSGGVGGNGVEKRYDTDGVLYTKDEFVQEYGAGGTWEWDQAERPKGAAAAAAPANGGKAPKKAPGATAAAATTNGASTAPAPAAEPASTPMSDAQKKESARLQTEWAAQQASAAPKAAAMRKARQRLPAYGSRAEVLATLARSQALVVCGETGCGKSTQVPQYILEEAIEKGRGGACTVLCAQPRRVAAVSLAQRVAAERGEQVGRTVGYSIRLESKMSQQTRLLFCTTGVVLRRLQEGASSLQGVSHVIVDEAHERSEDGDFLLFVLQQLLPHAPHLRVVLMSATLDARLFCDYYGGCPTITIPGRTFGVSALHLEDALELTAHAVKAGAEWARKPTRRPRAGEEDPAAGRKAR